MRISKERLSLIVAVTGISLIVIFSVIFQIVDDAESKNTKYIEKSLIALVEKCIKDNNCEKRTITLNELNSKGYLDNQTIQQLDGYSLDSYVGYPTRDVHLVK